MIRKAQQSHRPTPLPILRPVLIVLAPLLAGAAGFAQVPGCPAATPTCNNGVALASCGSGSAAYPWRCWQKELTSTAPTTYANAYRDLKIDVVLRWSQNPGINVHTLAYWVGRTADGLHDRFVFRMAFPPFTGSWNWTSTCSTLYGPESCSADTGLATSGSVTVGIQGTPNPLWTRGLLKQDSVSTQDFTLYKPLSHYDGTYFFWHGDTAWAASAQACRNQWQSYVDNRKYNGFTVVHLALSPRWAGPPAPAGFSGITSNMSGGQAAFEQLGGSCPSPQAGQVPFDRELAFPNCRSRWNPGYWQELDNMIQYANQQGLVVFLTGAAGPYDKWISDAAIRTFSRNLAAMTRGNFVILSPGFGGDPAECEPGLDCRSTGRYLSHLLDVAGEEIRTVSGYPPIVNHYGTVGTSSIDDLHAEWWLNVHGYQSGYSGANLSQLASRPKTMAQAIRYPTGGAFANPRKPALNAEAIYDYGYGVASEASTSLQHFNRYRARQAGYSSWLAGATGYTWGQVGLWEWGICGMQTLPDWAVAEKTCDAQNLNPDPTPQHADYRNYAGSMCRTDNATISRLMGNALRTMDFATLVANEQGRATSSPAPLPYRQFVVARDADRMVVYMPHNADVKVDLAGTGFETGFVANLFDPRNQVFLQPVQCSPVSGSTYRFLNPGGVSSLTVGTDDWVLVIDPGSSIPCSSQLAHVQSSDLSIFAAESPEGIRGLWARPQSSLTDDDVVLVEAVPAELPRKWSAARDEAGHTLVAWEHRDGFGGLAEVRARWLDPEGRPLGEVLRVSPSEGVDQLAPSVAVAKAGEALVAWVERSPITRAASVLTLGVSSAGAMEAAPSRLDHDDLLAPRRTRATCDAFSHCFVAWEEEDLLTGAVTARYRPVDYRSAAAVSADTPARVAAGDLWLGRPERDATGNAVLSWEEFDSRGKSKGRFALIMSESSQ